MSFTNCLKDSFGNKYWVRNDAAEAFFLIDEMMGEFDDQPEKLQYYRDQLNTIFEKYEPVSWK